MFAVLIALVVSVTAQPFALSENETREITAINKYRAARHLPPLAMDPILMKVARHRVKVYSHSAYGCSSWDEAKRAGYNGPVIDNLAQGQRTPEETVDCWARSPGHAKGMQGYINMNGRWTDYHFDEVGVAHCGNNWIAVFGKRKQ